MKIQYTLIAVFTLVAFSTLSDASAQHFRRAYRPVQNSYSSAAPIYHSNPVVNSTRVVSSHQVIQSHSPQSGTKTGAFETDLRHVYRPIKGGQTMVGANGQTLTLAKYIGTHRKDPNEIRLGKFQDPQNANIQQNHVKTNLANVTLWKEPLLDGTLRWVPLVNKSATTASN